MDQTERNIAILKNRHEAAVAVLRQDLEIWISDHSTPLPGDYPAADKFSPEHVAISAALLETALERYLALHGATAARELVTTCFDRQAEKYRRSLQ